LLSRIQVGAPTVFNFYLPDHQPVGELTQENLVAPELSLHNTRTSIEYINQVNQWTVWGAPWWSWDDNIGIETIRINYEAFPEEIKDPETLIQYFDLMLTGGLLAQYLILISPDFVIQK